MIDHARHGLATVAPVHHRVGRRAVLAGLVATLAMPHVARGWSGTMDARSLGVRPGTDEDMAPAMQAAVDAMADGGATLQLAPGRYRLGRTVRLKSGLVLAAAGAELFADGRWQTGAEADMISRFALVTNRNSAVAALTDHDITVRGAGFTYLGPQRGDAHAVTFRQVGGIVVTECRFNGGGDGTAFLACRGTLVERCTATGTLNCAYDHWEGTSDGAVRDSHALCAAGYGILFTGQGTARDNHQAAARLVASGNTIENPSTCGIWVCSLSEGSSVSEVDIDSNTVRGGPKVANGIGATGDVRDITIRRNVVIGINGGNSLFSRPDKWHRPRGIAITANTVRDCTPAAKSVALIQALGDQVVVTGNRASGGAYRSLVWADGDGVSLADNRGDALTSRFKYNTTAARTPRIDDP